MTFCGHVQGGVIVLDDAAQLPDGAIVEVRVITPSQKSLEARKALMRFSGIVDDLPPDASATVDRVLYGRPQE